MAPRTILLVMNSQTPDAEISAFAETAAQSGAHLLCLMIDALPTQPVFAYSAPPYGDMSIAEDWIETMKEVKDKSKSRTDVVEVLLARTNTSGEVQAVLSATADVKHHVARSARVSDEAVFASNLRDDPQDFMREAASGILFHSSIGFQINASADLTYDRIFIAWDSSEAASAAVHAALPYLRAANEIVIGCIDPVMTAAHDGQNPGSDVAAWLSHHGCKVTVSQFPSGGRSIDACILDQAREAGAGLVVMGAYGHARFIQTVFGGTTRSMVEQSDMPVLLAN